MCTWWYFVEHMICIFCWLTGYFMVVCCLLTFEKTCIAYWQKHHQPLIGPSQQVHGGFISNVHPSFVDAPVSFCVTGRHRFHRLCQPPTTTKVEKSTCFPRTSTTSTLSCGYFLLGQSNLLVWYKGWAQLLSNANQIFGLRASLAGR